MPPVQPLFPPTPPPPRSPHSSLWKRGRLLLLFGLVLLWSVLGGLGLAQARSGNGANSGERSNSTAGAIAQVISPAPEGLVDPVLPEFQLGQELYLENCASCHVGLPPATMPTETWRTVLTNPTHYGVQITPISEPSIYVVWNYISFYSRPLRSNEATPYRLRSSRYFRVLHPNVEFGSDRVTVRSCVACHPGAEQYDYRSLTPEWEDAP
ncbi:cytochrome C [Egbenema bharatensis]|uniref:cytochrome C n=1 Tax=Egbenema bharatensis TaxID=3463334 RepID=UPI003A853F79